MEISEVRIIDPEPGEGQLIQGMVDRMTPSRLKLYRMIDGMSEGEVEGLIAFINYAENTMRERGVDDAQRVL